jgi:hypothetical protein
MSELTDFIFRFLEIDLIKQLLIPTKSINLIQGMTKSSTLRIKMNGGSLV